MTRLTGVRWMFQKEYMHKPNYGISGSRSRLSVLVKIDMLDNALEMSVD